MPATSSAPSSSPGWRCSASGAARAPQAALEARADAAERAGDHAAALAHARELLALERTVRGRAPARHAPALPAGRPRRGAAGLRPLRAAAEGRGRRQAVGRDAGAAGDDRAPPRTPDAARAGPARLPASVLLPPRLVGRDAAWRALHEAWDAGRSAVVTGEGGMGKSRLAGDFARARGRHARRRRASRRRARASTPRCRACCARCPPTPCAALAAPRAAQRSRGCCPSSARPASSPDDGEGRARFFNAVERGARRRVAARSRASSSTTCTSPTPRSIELLQYVIGRVDAALDRHRARRRGVGAGARPARRAARRIATRSRCRSSR